MDLPASILFTPDGDKAPVLLSFAIVTDMLPITRFDKCSIPRLEE